MDEVQFWQIIDRARTAADSDVEDMANTLRTELRGYSKQQLIGFQALLVAQSDKIYTTKHAAAAELVCGPLGDDIYTDLRTWIIAQGSKFFESYLHDPDTLADLPEPDASCYGAENLGGAAEILYLTAGGDVSDEEWPILEPSVAPAGEPMSKRDARKAYPKLAAL